MAKADAWSQFVARVDATGSGRMEGSWIANTSGAVVAVLRLQNPLCTSSPDARGPCADLGYGLQGSYLANAAAPDLPSGSALVSGVFVSLAPATITMLEPFVAVSMGRRRRPCGRARLSSVEAIRSAVSMPEQQRIKT